uniref:Cry45Aa-like protein 2 n=1 Tax=Bacillus thuringiensis TaxID=1428 RepID=A0A1Q1NKN5_BACTU|nr:Cry45Aa-like protein 2 [Bacillus thuringiensis]
MAIIDLLKEIKIWGERAAKQHNTTLKSSGYLGRDPGNIYNYNMKVPDPIVTDNPTNSAYAKGTTPNPTSQPIVRTITFNETLTDSQSTTTEHGITAGASVTVKSEAGLLFAKVGVEATVSFEYNYTNSQTKTTEVSRSWSDSLQITVPPGYVTEHSFIVQTGPFNKNVVLECDIGGTGEIFLNDGRGYWVAISQILMENGVPGIRYNPNPYTAHFTGSGKLTGKMGLQSFVNVVERPLLGRAGQVREYQIPVTGRSGLDIPIFDPVISR